uniref:Angiotensin-converting enzyme n=1 Tax=Macrostomum lignano TaxID=282301 RepID=A0A1I8FZD8_9PLAT
MSPISGTKSCRAFSLALICLHVALTSARLSTASEMSSAADEDSASDSVGRVVSELRVKHHYHSAKKCWQGNLSRLSLSQRTRCARQFLRYSNHWLRVWDHREDLASFRYETDISEKNRQMLKRAKAGLEKFSSRLTLFALKFKKFKMKLSRREARMMKLLQGKQVFKSNRNLLRYNQVQSRIMQDYNQAVGCYAPGKCLDSGEDNVENFFRTKKDYDQLRYLWKSWRDATGAKFRNAFVERAQLLNESVWPSVLATPIGEVFSKIFLKIEEFFSILGFRDYAYFDYFTAFEDPKFPETVVSLYNQFKPLYEQLHAYLRHRLHQKYPGKFAANGLLPGHLGDDPWGSQYTKWHNEFVPFPAAESIDFDGILKDRERRGLLTVPQLPHVADEFYRSLGLPKMTETFWRKSVFLKPKDHKMNCHGTAFDMHSASRDDFRIKIFSTVHHEMGHIMYFMLYSHQPVIFRRGANGGFHEAIGDTITLSVLTPKHFKAIKFIKHTNDTSESLVNNLFTQALANVMFLPYALVADLWKWRYFGGQVPKEQLNQDWWQLRSRFGGIGPPVTRSEADTDALSKFHLAIDVSYIRYFVSFLLKFQFYKALCQEAGHLGSPGHVRFLQTHSAARPVQALAGCSPTADRPKGHLGRCTDGQDKRGTMTLSSSPTRPVGLLLLAVAVMAVFALCADAYRFRDDESSELSHLLMKLRRDQHRKHCWKYSLDGLTESQLTKCARRFIHFANQQLRKRKHRSSLASFHYNVNINKRNKELLTRVDTKYRRFSSKLTLFALKFKGKRMSGLSASDARMLRDLQWNMVFGRRKDSSRMSNLDSQMSQSYDTAVGCYAPGKCLDSGEDNVKNFFRTKNDYDQLRYLWKSWRNATGAKFRNAFVERAQLLNESVRPAGFKNYAFFEYFTDFEDPKFPETVVSLYNQFKPLYEQLHAYLRHRLHQKYPGKFAANGLLPGHLGDDPWGSQYTKWHNEFVPFPAAESIDFDGILKDRERRGLLTVPQLPHVADEFYRSLGLPKMTETFWRKSVFLKPKDHKMNCHGTAFDMHSASRDDFRIKMCTRMDMSSFSTVHHEMGHIMYFMLYSHQPVLFQGSANSGFHEAIGDTITLSVKTAEHFQAIKFAKHLNDTHESQVNTQLTQALENVMFLPFAMTVDLWKWRYISGEVPKEQLNQDWWRLRGLYAGVGPSVSRSEADTDALSKYHAAKNIGYVRYFISFLLKFQFYKAMCEEAGHKGPLSTCDFYKSTAAGDKLRRMLQLGRSKPWPDALQQLTGRRDISADALMEYFQPLHNWLKDYNAKNGVPVGWTVPANPMQSASN